MNVKKAIEKMEQRLVRAQDLAGRYISKGNEMDYLLAECTPDNSSRREKARISSKRNYYYNAAAVAEDYVAELEEFIEFLRGKGDGDKVLFTSEEKLENEYALWGCIEDECANAIATVIKVDLDDGTNIYVVSLRKLVI